MTMKQFSGLIVVLFTVMLLTLQQPVKARVIEYADRKIDIGRYFALVIGINAYKNLPALKTAREDASDVAKILERKYGFTTTLLLDATRVEIIKALDRFRATLQENDNLLIYYAGHGVLDAETDTGFWLPVDAEADNEAEWIEVGTITRNAKAMASRHVLIVADSCYSGTLTRSVPAQLQTARDRAAWLERMNEKRSRTALTSGGLEPVLDGGGGRNSVFARAFIDALRENDTVIEGHHLFRRLRVYVTENSDQTPEYADIRKAGHDGGDFLFVPVSFSYNDGKGSAITTENTAGQPRPGAAPQLRGATSETELAFWEAVEKSDSIAAYRSYLKRWPAGSFADIARIRIADIGKKKEKEDELREAMALEKRIHAELREEIALQETLKQEIASERKTAMLLGLNARYASRQDSCRFAGEDQVPFSFAIALDLHNGRWEARVRKVTSETRAEERDTVFERSGAIPDDGLIRLVQGNNLKILIQLKADTDEQEAVLSFNGRKCRTRLARS